MVMVKPTTTAPLTTANNVGRFLTVPIPRPPPARLVTPSPLPSGFLASPTEDGAHILYEPMPKLGRTPAKTPTLVIVPPPSPSDADGFTPVTPPTPSPRSRAFNRIRASQLPRDALGIATAAFSRMKSQRAVGGAYGDEYDDDDMEPLSPPYDARPMDAQVAVKAKPARRTLFGVLEGWWDLGLLDRARSIKRKG